MPLWEKCFLLFLFAILGPGTESWLAEVDNTDTKNSKSHVLFTKQNFLPGSSDFDKSEKNLQKRCQGRQEGTFL